MTKRDYLTVDSLTSEELAKVLDVADEFKRDRRPRDDLAGKSIGMIFEKPSTRTRISFEVGIAELGGHPVILNASELQLGRGETLEDTARVLSRYLHAVVVRTFAQSRLEMLAAAGTIPVINALSDFTHPCQALADLQTIREHRGGLEGLKLAYLGDGNNVVHSLLKAGALAGMRVAIGSPAGYEPIPQVVDQATRIAAHTGGDVFCTADPLEAAADADVVYTDVWASMGQEGEAAARTMLFRPFQVNRQVMDAAKPDALVMHCLPAHRGEEISADVIDGPNSVVFDQAENRLHSQKALLTFLLT
ncbi:MAG: ornithine carbamoyltransferase [Nitriliruptorales bacterium]|nr:ornithine carbamoyltransferase [Nitriliruptorales bacterium]